MIGRLFQNQVEIWCLWSSANLLALAGAKDEKHALKDHDGVNVEAQRGVDRVEGALLVNGRGRVGLGAVNHALGGHEHANTGEDQAAPHDERHQGAARTRHGVEEGRGHCRNQNRASSHCEGALHLHVLLSYGFGIVQIGDKKTISYEFTIYFKY